MATGAVTTAAWNQIAIGVSADGQELMLVAYSPNNGGTCWAVSDNDGSASPLGAAPAGTEYTRVEYQPRNRRLLNRSGQLPGRWFRRRDHLEGVVSD